MSPKWCRVPGHHSGLGVLGDCNSPLFELHQPTQQEVYLQASMNIMNAITMRLFEHVHRSVILVMFMFHAVISADRRLVSKMMTHLQVRRVYFH